MEGLMDKLSFRLRLDGGVGFELIEKIGFSKCRKVEIVG